MRDEPETGKLQMNAIQHEEPGSAQLERDGRSALQQPETDLANRRSRGEIHLDRSRAQLTRLIGQRMEDRKVVRRFAARSGFAVQDTRAHSILLAATVPPTM